MGLVIQKTILYLFCTAGAVKPPDNVVLGREKIAYQGGDLLHGTFGDFYVQFYLGSQMVLYPSYRHHSNRRDAPYERPDVQTRQMGRRRPPPARPAKRRVGCIFDECVCMMAFSKNKFKEGIYSSPLLYGMMFLLIAALCVSFPLDWLGINTDSLWIPTVLRIAFSIIGIVLIIIFGFSRVFKFGKDAIKNWDIALVAIFIAVNNFPIIALLNKEAVVSADTSKIISFICYCFSVGLFEEIFFRGLILSVFLIYFKSQKYGSLWAVIVSSIIFSLMHILNLFSGTALDAVFLQVGYTFLNGMVYSLLFYFTKSIYLSVLCHALFDVGGLMVGYLGVGQVWNAPTIIMTVIVSVVAGVYLAVRFIVRIKKEHIKRKDKYELM